MDHAYNKPMSFLSVLYTTIFEVWFMKRKALFQKCSTILYTFIILIKLASLTSHNALSY